MSRRHSAAGTAACSAFLPARAARRARSRSRTPSAPRCRSRPGRPRPARPRRCRYSLVRRRNRHVVELGVGDDRQVGRQRPGGRGPDDERRLLLLEARVGLAQIADDREAHVDRRRGVVLVLDLGLGQRRVMREAPVHRLLVAVDEPRAREPGQLAGDGRLVVLRQRQVGVVPVAEAAEPLELGAHDVDELQRVLLAVVAERGRVQLLASFGPAPFRPAARSAARGSPSRAGTPPACPSAAATARRCPSAPCSAPCRSGWRRWRRAGRRAARKAGASSRARLQDALVLACRAPSGRATPARGARDRRASGIRSWGD